MPGDRGLTHALATPDDSQGREVELGEGHRFEAEIGTHVGTACGQRSAGQP